MIDGHAEGQIEVAVIEGPVPVDADLMTAHQMREGRWIKGILQDFHVGLHLTVPVELFSISPDRHIGQDDQPIELDIESMSEFLVIVLLQLFLRRGKKGSSGIIGKMQREPLLMAVTDPIEHLDRGNRLFVDTVAALGI